MHYPDMHPESSACATYPLSISVSLSVSVFLARSGKNGAKMRLNANRSRVKSTKQGKQFLMPNEKQCSKLNEEPKKARIFVLKTVGGKNDIKTMKQSGEGGIALELQGSSRIFISICWLFSNKVSGFFLFACVVAASHQRTSDKRSCQSGLWWEKRKRSALKAFEESRKSYINAENMLRIVRRRAWQSGNCLQADNPNWSHQH